VSETEQPPTRQPLRGASLILEAFVVCALGLLFALTANSLSPRGLSLGRNYFPATTRSTLGAASNVTSAVQRASSTGQTVLEHAVARLKENGLQPISGPEVLQLFHDPQYAQELIVFVDARDDTHYQAGHVPGAYQFDRYYPQNHLPFVLPACLNAVRIVVYCTGGTCEDSEFAALALRDAGVLQDRLFVYTGGISEWTTNGWPVEVGTRKSGNIHSAKP
jgi:rhodanese-related sulfurtransferase